MKKILILMLLFFLSPVFAAEELIITDMQVAVLPRDVYVGDEMEIRCIFNSDSVLLPEDQLSIEIPALEVKDCTISKILLQRAGSSYMLSVLCTPWCLGSIDLPPVKISGYPLPEEEAAGEEEADSRIEQEAPEDPDVFLDIPAVSLKSIVEYTGASELRPVQAPILIPGTMWVVYLLCATVILVIAALIVILVRLRSFRRKVSDAAHAVVSFGRYSSLRYLMKKLIKGKKEVPDAVFAQVVSRSIREYLSARFAHNFRSETPEGIVRAFEELFCGIFSVEAGMAIQDLSDVLYRCDYVRFSGDKGEKGTLTREERVSLCSGVLSDAECLRKDMPDAEI